MRRWQPRLVLLLLLLLAAACEDREDCDKALALVCACPSRPCEREEEVPVVRARRRCDESDIRPDNEGINVHLCIQNAPAEFCELLDGVLAEDDRLCDVRCNSQGATCRSDLKHACERYQH